MPVTDESNGKVQAQNDEHALVEQSKVTTEILWSFHVLLQGQDQRDAFERVDGRTEEEWQRTFASAAHVVPERER